MLFAPQAAPSALPGSATGRRAWTRRPARWDNSRLLPGIERAAVTKIIADSARPETIDHMKRRGFLIEPAIKGAGSVKDGINFLKSYHIVVHPRCRHLSDELVHYSWAVDRLNGEVLSRLSDAHNHVIDALRYALEGARKARSRGFTIKSTGRRLMAKSYGKSTLHRCIRASHKSL